MQLNNGKIHALILAYQDADDLPEQYKQFSSIDAYGDVQNHTPMKKHMRIVNKPYTLATRGIKTYNHCFIRHPDPWGDPRSWANGIAAIGSRLKGDIECVFYRLDEVGAFNYMLRELINPNELAFNDVQTIHSHEQQASWTITRRQRNMRKRYKQNIERMVDELNAKVQNEFHFGMTDIQLRNALRRKNLF